LENSNGDAISGIQATSQLFNGVGVMAKTCGETYLSVTTTLFNMTLGQYGHPDFFIWPGNVMAAKEKKTAYVGGGVFSSMASV
jgi:hypothetical protein